MSRLLRGLICAGAAFAGASAAHADAFTVTSVPTNTVDFGYLSSASNADNLLVNLNGGNVTINGANFTGGGTTGTGTGGVSYALSGANITPFSGFNAGATDPNVNTLLNTFFYGGNNRSETLTVNGLTPGNTATITVLGAAFGAGSVGGRAQSLTGSQGATLPLYEENNGAFSTLAYTALVPASGTLSFTSTATDATPGTLHYYGFTVAQEAATPEPAALGLLGLGGLALAGRRRRRTA